MLSICIPIFNNSDMTHDCINAIRENTHDFELVIVDNGSEPAFKPPFMGFAETTLIRNLENKGFPVAVNQGIRAAAGDVIILLNNDVIVTPGALNRLAGLVRHKAPIVESGGMRIDVQEITAPGDDFKVFDFGIAPFSIVGPCTNYAAGLQRVQIGSYQNREELDKEAAFLAEENAGESEEVNYIIGFCMAFKRRLFDEIGPFDESLWPCSGEEIDFCLKARAAGHKVGIAHDVYVHHEGSQTFKDMDVDYEGICKRNDAHLAEKWGDAWGWDKQSVAPICEGVRLNMGCGPFPMEGFTNIDQFSGVNPDLCCDVTKLPYEPATVSEIYAGHILEHFRFDEGQKVLRYWLMLLKPGGMISISVPDFDFLVKEYAAEMTPERLIEFNDTYIYSYVQPSPHQYAYSAALLEKVMTEAGFVDVKRMPQDHPYFPFAVDWQVGFTGVRP